MTPDPMARLAPEQTADDLDGTAFVHLHGALRGAFSTADFASAAAIVARVTEAAEAAGHHPEVRLGWGRVAFELASHDAGGVTSRDVELAVRIHSTAVELGGEPVLRPPSVYELAIDAGDAEAVRPFWRAVLDYTEVEVDGGAIELADPRQLGPRVWFQEMSVARTDRNRLHVDVYVAPEQASSRLSAVLEAGGILITDEFAPDWWVVADAEGNEACICTSSR